MNGIYDLYQQWQKMDSSYLPCLKRSDNQPSIPSIPAVEEVFQKLELNLQNKRDIQLMQYDQLLRLNLQQKNNLWNALYKEHGPYCWPF